MTSFLQKYQRQPKLFIDLPSKGKWYDESVLDGGQFTQIPVFGMNAMDEIMFKTPDALFSGEATAQVIRSCIPTILDPWQLVGYDIDYILIALRIATYSDKLPITTSCPVCQYSTDSEISLTNLLGNFENYETEFAFSIDNLTFNLRPITYKQTTDFSLENYTLERQLTQIKQIDPTKENAKELDKQLQTIYNQSSLLNMNLAISHIESIVDSNGELESNVEVINDFIKNNDAEFYSKLKEGIHTLTRKWNLPNIEVECGGEDCDNKYKSSLDVDYSNFFGVRSLRSRNLIS
jgi:hypothetical protein